VVLLAEVNELKYSKIDNLSRVIKRNIDFNNQQGNKGNGTNKIKL
jgi:hypothetical protein